MIRIAFGQLQDRLAKLRENRLFETFVIIVIIFSALVIGAKTYRIPPQAMTVMTWLDTGITLFFLFEIVVRILAAKSLARFFSSGWNIFDFIIVSVSLIPIDESEMALLGRLLRIFRILRLVSLIPELRVLLNAFLLAIPRMGYVSLLMFIIFYIYAAFGSILFVDINPGLWGNISIAMLTLFRVATFEDWTDVMYETMGVYPLSWLFYLSFIFIVAFVFLNMMIGIVLETLRREHELHELGSREDAAEATRSHGEVMTAIETRLTRIEQLLVESQTAGSNAQRHPLQEPSTGEIIPPSPIQR